MAKRNEKQNQNKTQGKIDDKEKIVNKSATPPDAKKTLSERIDYIESTNTYRIIKLVIPFLAIIGLAYAVWDNYDSNRQSEEIVKQISTQYVNKFPKQIKYFTEKIKAAKKKIVIAVDHPAYGVFSNPEHFNDYWIKLQDKFNKETNANFEKLTLIYYSKEKREYEFLKQFGISKINFSDSTIFNRYYKENSEKVDLFSEQNNGIILKTWEDVFTIIEKRNEEILSTLTTRGLSGSRFEKIEIEKEDDPLPVYFWMFDDDSFAFLSFRSFGKLTEEVTISTSHPPIITYLKSIQEDVK